LKKRKEGKGRKKMFNCKCFNGLRKEGKKEAFSLSNYATFSYHRATVFTFHLESAISYSFPEIFSLSYGMEKSGDDGKRKQIKFT